MAGQRGRLQPASNIVQVLLTQRVQVPAHLRQRGTPLQELLRMRLGIRKENLVHEIERRSRAFYVQKDGSNGRAEGCDHFRSTAEGVGKYADPMQTGW